MFVMAYRSSILVLSSCLAMTAASAQAALVITLTEQAISGTTAIVATYSGSLDLSATTPSGSGQLGGSSPNFLMAVRPSVGELYLHPGSVNFYPVTPQGGAFGTGTATNAYVRAPATSAGARQYSYDNPAPAYGLTGLEFALSSGYSFGDLISGTTNFLTTTFADWGVTPGGNTTYTINGTTETVSINVVPEPTVLAAAACGLGLAGVLASRRRRDRHS
jgi:hypothetical protein